jgi:hypothetical protein
MNPRSLTIVCDSNPNMKHSYPYFGKCVNEDGFTIVFFTSPKTGYVFGGNDKSYKPFEYAKTWKEWAFEVVEVSEIEIKEKVSTIISHNTKL